MHRRMACRAMLVALACLVVLPLAASAQSSIVGLVRDESGGVLPGVSVEVASPALIEKGRTSVTDAQGRYRLADLRRGTYRVTFAAAGFSTVVRDGVELPPNVTATVNAVLAPPTARNVTSAATVVPGIRQATPDVGGSQLMNQTAMRAHGISERNVTQLVDGMMINSEEINGENLAMWDDALSRETSVTTSAIPADTAAGGVCLNIIPKDGGNVISGSVFLGGSNGTWQASNVTDKLRARGIKTGNGIAHVQNFNGSIGGPIRRDTLWFFMAARHTSTDERVANVPKEIILPDGRVTRGLVDQFVRDVALRLTWQIDAKNKLAAMFERMWRWKGKSFAFGQDPRSATHVDDKKALAGPGEAKWTSTLGSTLLFEGGYSTALNQITSWPQPENHPARGTPEWYASTTKTDTALNADFYPQCAYVTGCTIWGSGLTYDRGVDQRHVVMAAASYVTGAHAVKVGVQDTFGKDDQLIDRIGDVYANFVNGKPQTVTVYNTPMIGRAHVDYDVGIYAQDT